MDNSQFSARRGKATVTSSHDFISDTPATLRGNAKRVYGARRVEQRYPTVIECLPMASVRSGSGTSALSRWLMRAKTIPVSGTRKRGAHVRFWPKADIPFCTAHVRFWG